MAAARWGHHSIVQLLLGHYAATESALMRFINAVDIDRNTALMHAAKHGHLSTIRLLLDAKSAHFAAVSVLELDTQNKCLQSPPLQHPQFLCDPSAEMDGRR
jgi:ankyrin repeat protein